MSRQVVSIEKREEIQKRISKSALTQDDLDLYALLLEYGLDSKDLLRRKLRSEQRKTRARQPREKDGDQEPKGHGRIGEEKYTGARDETVPLNKYRPGDRCPCCGRGNLYIFEVKKLLTLMARSPVDAVRYLLTQLRCNSCGELFEEPPPEAKWGKHHPSAIAAVTLLRYGLGVPGKRLETWQGHFGIPLPDATQWDMIKKIGSSTVPIFKILENWLAQCHALSTDDTSLKVLELLQEFQTRKKGDRYGCHATCIHGVHNERPIILYYVGRKHAGENMGELLALRSPDSDPPLQIGDASANNTKHDHEVIPVYCNAHSFLKFQNACHAYPEIVDYILSLYGAVFSHDRSTRDMDDMQRLVYHQKHSRPLMDNLYRYFHILFEEHVVEPNSPLGEAITYMLKRWDGFTRFLEIPGVPLDNNSTERNLKGAIRYRKNSGFFKTIDSARLGAITMSILATITANGVNPMDYLSAIQIHESDVQNVPHLWLPWNYRERLQDVA